MRAFLHTIILVICSQFLLANAPNAYLKGKVTDRQSGEPLPGVLVLYQKNRGTITDEKGNYLLQSEAGMLNVTFRMLGFKSVSRNVILKAMDTVVLHISLEPDAIEIDQVVVTGSRIEQRVAEQTVSMSIIKPESISNQHITNAEELIDKSSGIEVLDGQASIRGGSGFSYGAGSRVLVLVDGLSIVAADAGNIRWQFLPLDNLSQIEIIKGASSVAYGSSALNGVINFRTADATVYPVTTAYLEGGFYDKPKNKNWIWWNSPRIFSSVGFNHLRKIGSTDIGFGLNVNKDNGYRERNEDGLGRINFKLKHFNQKIKGLSYGLSLNGGQTRKSDFVLWENATTGALKQDTSTAIFLKGTFFAIDPFVTFKKAGKYSHELKMRIQHSKNVFPDSDQNDSDAFTIYSEYQLWYHFSHRLSLNSGLAQNYGHILSNFYGNHKSLNLGAFSQVEYVPIDRLKLVGGMRIEHNTLDNVSDQITPLFRAGMNYQLKEYTFLRASYGQGYRYPSIAERHAATTLGAVKIFPSLYIQPESGWNTEIGIKQGLKTKYFAGQIDLAFFYTQNKDLIEYVFGLYPNPGSSTYSFGFRADNIEASRVYGAELEWMLTNQMGNVRNTVSGGYVFMFPIEFNPFTGHNTENYLKYRRKHAAKLNISSQYRKFEAGLNLFVRSKMLRIDDVFLNELTRESLLPGFYDYWKTDNKGHLIIDLQCSYAITHQLKLSLVVKNLSNVEYMGRPGDIQPQRSFSLRLSGNF